MVIDIDVVIAVTSLSRFDIAASTDILVIIE
jgi:hypothetical protein